MTKPSILSNEIEIVLQLTDHRQNPEAAHKGIQSLHEMLSKVYGMDAMNFTLRRVSPYSSDHGQSRQSSEQLSWLYIGAEFRLPLDKFKVVLRCLCNWLDLISQRASIEVKIPLARMITSPPAQSIGEYPLNPIIITVEAENAKDIAKIFSLVEAVLPSQVLYQKKIKAYIEVFGELTPAVRANLNILRHSMNMPRKEDYELKAEGLFEDLSEKYHHFREELKVIRQEDDLTNDFWKVMQDKAVTMQLPDVDAKFLRDEHRQVLRAREEYEHQSGIEEMKAEIQKQKKREKQLIGYQKDFENIIISSSEILSFNYYNDVDSFSDNIIKNIFDSDFNKGCLEQAREFYELDQQQIADQEKNILRELYFLLNLIYGVSASIVLRS